MMNKASICLLLIVVVITISSSQASFLRQVFGHSDGPLVDDELSYTKPGITAAELIEARGYKAKEFKFATRDGYYLSITRGTNPLINKGERGLDDKLPILFLHGSTLPASTYILNSVGVRPKVLHSKGVDMAKMTTEKLGKMLKGEPSVRSLAFLAMNFGHEVWLLDRRGYGKSRGKVGHENRTLDDAIASLPMSLIGNVLDNGFSLTAGMDLHRQHRGDEEGSPERRQKRQTSDSGDKHTSGSSSTAATNPKRFNFLQALFAAVKLIQSSWNPQENLRANFIDTFYADYWKYSLDEQAEFDFPDAVDFVLKETGKKKVHAVGMSCGGAVILLALAEQPKLAKKISRAVLWAPSVNMGSTSDVVYLFSQASAMFQSYSGPIPFVFLVPYIEKFMAIACNSDFMQRTICEAALGAIMGFSGGQGPVRSFMAGNLFRPTCANELVHLSQMTRTRTPCKFSLNTRKANFKKYGQEKAPCYDLGKIELRNVSMYVGATDSLVSIDDVKSIARQMRVPAETHFINKRGIYFNHMGFFLHKNLDKLAVLPSLIDIERSELHHHHSDQLDGETSDWNMANLKGVGRKVFESLSDDSNDIDERA